MMILHVRNHGLHVMRLRVDGGGRQWEAEKEKEASEV